MKRFFISAILMFIMGAAVSFAQNSSLNYLRQQCPQLTELYQTELENCHAHYVMAVDVSLSMCRYEPDVLPALKSFVGALPIGDKVTLIPFAKNAYDNKMGFDVEITNETKSSLLDVLNSLYPKGAEKQNKEYYDTDIYAAQQAVARSVQQNAQYDVNIIIFITDMMHCPSDNVDRQFNDTEVGEMTRLLKASNSDKESRVFALELPRSGNPVGYVLPKMKELYKSGWGTDLEEVQVPQNSEALIGQWFEKQKDRIMFTKLQAIIISENKANPIVARTEVDIDGNVKGTLKWKAGKLYPKITLDSTYIAGNSSFLFKGNKDYVGYSAVGEIDEENMDLGRIKNRSMFFHKLADTLHFDVSLPVPYQNEIDKLLEGRPGPVANATEYKERLVWTFFLPLWLSGTLLALLILYILMVFRAAVRNGKTTFSGEVIVNTIDGDPVCKRRLTNVKQFTVGTGGDNGLGVSSAGWSIIVRRKVPSPFAVFSTTSFQWSKGAGFVSTKGKTNTRGTLDKNNTLVKLDGGPTKGNISHKVTIKYFMNK